MDADRLAIEYTTSFPVEVPTVPTLDSEGNYHGQVATAKYLLRDRRRITYTILVQLPLDWTTYHYRLCESHASNMIVQGANTELCKFYSSRQNAHIIMTL
ncbi:hypothetical protein J4E89_002072 [Alternaria sp. Ai002NY15]|nr:hypothetical protein J4E89_002072 [Alternaria sp. Ai002NY15]